MMTTEKGVQKEAVIVREKALSHHLEAEVQHRCDAVCQHILVGLRREKRERVPKSQKNLMVFATESRTGWIQIVL